MERDYRRRETPLDSECSVLAHPVQVMLWSHVICFDLGIRITGEFRTRSALFWNFTQRRMAVCYRRFGTNYQSHFQGSSSPKSQNVRCLRPTTDLFLSNHIRWNADMPCVLTLLSVVLRLVTDVCMTCTVGVSRPVLTLP